MKLSSQRNPEGFTLIELMIVVAIIGILAAVAIPKFGDLVNRGKEASAKSNLGMLRSALTIYYGDNDSYPSDLTVGLAAGNKYVKEVPAITIPPYSVNNNPGHDQMGGVASVLDDMITGAWLYLFNSPSEAFVSVNCSHRDSRGILWSSY